MLTEEEKKQRRRESQKRYRDTHKEKIKEYSRGYNKKYYWEHKEENREKHNAECSEYYNKNKDSINDKRRLLYQEDEEYREKIKQSGKKYRDENKESLKKYRDSTKEERSAYNKKYSKGQRGRANNLLTSYRRNDEIHKRGKCTITTDWILEHIFLEPCVYCGVYGWEIMGCDRKDNSLPHTLDNCVPCCKECNSKKGTMSYDEYMKKVRNES